MAVPADARNSAAVVTAVLFANVIVFLLWLVLPLEVMAGHFLVSWQHLTGGRVWTLLTAVFSHNLLFHFLINMIVLSSFGPPLARLLGARRFLVFYLVAGMVGSLAHAGVSRFLIGAPELAALGASSAIAGVLLLFAVVFPRAKVLFFLVIPVPAIVAVLLFVGIDIWGLMVQIAGRPGLPIGHGAHLGGTLTGLVYYLIRRDELSGRAPSGVPPG